MRERPYTWLLLGLQCCRSSLWADRKYCVCYLGGKTYTMGTNTTTMDCNEEGMIPKVIKDLFTEIEKRKQEAQFCVKASFLEIYNQQIIDLLDTHKNIKQAIYQIESNKMEYQFAKKKMDLSVSTEPYSNRLMIILKC